MESQKEKDRIIVLSIDRDNDLGMKAGVPGPVIGKEAVIEAASKLGVKDPGDTDMNAMFEAVRVYEEVRRQNDCEVAILTGDRDVGVKSDREIKDQLEKVLRRFRANLAVIVSDGSEDEHVTPIIQSLVPILSMKRVVVKQSEKLESTYYKIKDFLKESLDDPKMARIVFGFPALCLLLIAFFGMEGWRAVIGILGVYLVLKAFKLDIYFDRAGKEAKDSFTGRRVSFFLYTLGVAVGLYASYRGYGSMGEWSAMGLFESVAAFISSSVHYFWLAAALFWIGYVIGAKNRSFPRAVSIPLFGFAVALVVRAGADLILQPEASITYFMASIIAGFALLFLAAYLERKK